jgi:hypothetical protein
MIWGRQSRPKMWLHGKMRTPGCSSSYGPQQNVHLLSLKASLSFTGMTFRERKAFFVERAAPDIVAADNMAVGVVSRVDLSRWDDYAGS